MISGRILALFVLARSLVKVFFDRLFRAKTGLPLFRQNYDADRLPPLDAEERAAMPGLSGCIACGRCDHGEGSRMGASEGAYPGLMAFVLASSRSMPDFDAAALALAHLDEGGLEAKELRCPTAVPLRALVRFVRRKAVLVQGTA